MNENYCNEAVVKRVDGLEVVVEMTINSACAACHAKDLCLAHERREELITVTVGDPSIFSVGDTVLLQMHKSMGHKAVVLAYLIPVFILLAIMLGLYSATGNELLSVLLALLLMVIYFFSLRFFKSKFEKTIQFTISKK